MCSCKVCYDSCNIYVCNFCGYYICKLCIIKTKNIHCLKCEQIIDSLYILNNFSNFDFMKESFIRKRFKKKNCIFLKDMYGLVMLNNDNEYHRRINEIKITLCEFIELKKNLLSYFQGDDSIKNINKIFELLYVADELKRVAKEKDFKNLPRKFLTKRLESLELIIKDGKYIFKDSIIKNHFLLPKRGEKQNYENYKLRFERDTYFILKKPPCYKIISCLVTGMKNIIVSSNEIYNGLLSNLQLENPIKIIKVNDLFDEIPFLEKHSLITGNKPNSLYDNIFNQKTLIISDKNKSFHPLLLDKQNIYILAIGNLAASRLKISVFIFFIEHLDKDIIQNIINSGFPDREITAVLETLCITKKKIKFSDLKDYSSAITLLEIPPYIDYEFLFKGNKMDISVMDLFLLFEYFLTEIF